MTEPSQPGAASRFAETLLDILDQVSYRRVMPGEALDPVYRLRYEAYRREDFIDVNAQEITRDDYDDAPNCHTFGVYIGDQLASSVRLHVVNRFARISPSRLIFPEVLDGFIDEGNTYIDPSRFTADRELTLTYPALPFLTLRVAVMAVEHFKARYCISSVRAEHGAFYRRVFGATLQAGDAHFPGLKFPVRLYVTDCAEAMAPMMRRYPFFRSSAAERHALFQVGEPENRVISTARKAHMDAFSFMAAPA